MASIKSITRRCMGTGKPLVSVLLAVYKPNEKWLREQLKSLNEQSYPNIEILVCDDCPEFPVDDGIIAECVTKFPFTVFRNDKNLGSNKTFERLTELGKGKYFSYCDQDDVWRSDKVERMVEVLEKTGSPLVCCDLAIIDGDGKLVANSITKVRKRHIFLEGENLAETLLVRNFVSGCAMMMKADVAKESIPFVDSLVHDQWLAIKAALSGRIEVIREALIEHREHGDNQTNVLKDIYDKNSYYNERLIKFKKRIAEYKARLYNDELKAVIDELDEFYNARINYFNKVNLHDLKIMKKYKLLAPDSVLLESVIHFIPNFVFKKILNLARRGKI